MTRKTRVHLDGDPERGGLPPKHLTNAEFGERIYTLMRQRGWHQSELARRAGLTRDAISTYVNGRVLPSPTSLDKLAAAFGMSAESLLPNIAMGAIEADTPSVEIKVSNNAPSTAWLRVNRLVSLSAALKVAEILDHDTPPADRK